jgi:transcriptional regulator with XRE-family HTH domain/soluble cytochrome b562
MSRPRYLTARGVAVGLIRSLRGWNQSTLAKASWIDKSLISRYERGTKVPSLRTLERLCIAAEIPFSWLERQLPEISGALAALKTKLSEVALPETITASGEADSPLVEFGAKAPPTLEQARREAKELWDYLKERPARERRILVEGAKEYQGWAFCERLCSASESEAPDDPGKAVELAELAVRVAELSRGEHTLIEGYAWAFLGNARRAQGQHASAEAAFARFEQLWKAWNLADCQPLKGWLPLDLLASLRRHQDRCIEAIDLHERALSLATPSEHGLLLLNKAKTLEEMSRFGEAVETLKYAEPLIEAAGDPRLSFALRCNMAVNLCHLDRFVEADVLLPDVKRHVEGLGTRLDKIRVRWLEGMVAAGLGQKNEALAALREVQREFSEREIGFDFALVTLDLALVHLEQGDTSEVKALAQQMAPIFRAQGVQREALAALRLFWDAAKRETATVDLARRVLKFLHRAQHDQGLKFEPGSQAS